MIYICPARCNELESLVVGETDSRPQILHSSNRQALLQTLESHARILEDELRKFDLVPMLNPELVVAAAKNYRILRSEGITIRKTIDLVIGTFCIAHQHTLLHDDSVRATRMDFFAAVPLEEPLAQVNKETGRQGALHLPDWP